MVTDGVKKSESSEVLKHDILYSSTSCYLITDFCWEGSFGKVANAQHRTYWGHCWERGSLFNLLWRIGFLTFSWMFCLSNQLLIPCNFISKYICHFSYFLHRSKYFKYWAFFTQSRMWFSSLSSLTTKYIHVWFLRAWTGIYISCW